MTTTITWERVVEAEDVSGIDAATHVSTARRMNFASWISIMAAATSLPLLIFQIAASTLSTDAHTVQTALRAFDAILGAYLCRALYRLWHRGVGFHPADTVIAWWTGFGAVFCAISLSLPSWGGGPIGFTPLLMGVTIGALCDIAFGIVLLRLKDDPYGCLNAYAFSHIVLGVGIILSTMF